MPLATWRKQMQNKFIMIFLLMMTCSLVIAIWYNQEPTVKPEDITIQAKFVPIELATKPVRPVMTGNYTLEVELDRKTNISLINGQYFHMVIPYIESISFGATNIDFFQGIDDRGHEIGSEAPYYGFGNDPRTKQVAVEALESLGLNPKADELDHGYFYRGDTFPTRVRFYVETGRNFRAQQTQAFVLYVHYETRWGRNLSWAKLEPIEITDPPGQAPL